MISFRYNNGIHKDPSVNKHWMYLSFCTFKKTYTLWNTLKILTLKLWALTTATRAQIISALNIDYICDCNENFFLSKTKINLELHYLLCQFLIVEEGILCRWNKCSDRFFSLLHMKHVIIKSDYIIF